MDVRHVICSWIFRGWIPWASLQICILACYSALVFRLCISSDWSWDISCSCLSQCVGQIYTSNPPNLSDEHSSLVSWWLHLVCLHSRWGQHVIHIDVSYDFGAFFLRDMNTVIRSHISRVLLFQCCIQVFLPHPPGLHYSIGCLPEIVGPREDIRASGRLLPKSLILQLCSLVLVCCFHIKLSHFYVFFIS